MTWNWRGRQMIAAMASSVSVIQLKPPPVASKRSRRVSSRIGGDARKRSPKPSNSTVTTNSPAARKAISLTIDSKAMAATRPW